MKHMTKGGPGDKFLGNGKVDTSKWFESTRNLEQEIKDGDIWFCSAPFQLLYTNTSGTLAPCSWAEDIHDRGPNVLAYGDKFEKRKTLKDYYLHDPTLNKILHGGKLEYKDNKPFRYKINITEHVSDLINLNDGDYTENIPLSLVVTSDVAFIRSRKAILKNGVDKITIPEGTIYNPLGTLILNENPPFWIDKWRFVKKL